LILAACIAAASAGTAQAARVVDLLQDLIATGVNVLYSSELVPPSLTAPKVLTGSTPLSRVMEALAAHDLVLRQTSPRNYLVMRGSNASPSHPAAAVTPTAHSDESLAQLSVFANRYEFTMTTLGAPLSLKDGQIEEIPGADVDALRAVDAAPGLVTNLSARPYVRGALLDDVLVEYDGIPLADPFHFKTFQSVLSAFDPSTVARADIYTGGFPVKYGTRSGGVIDLTPRSIDSGSEYVVGVSSVSYDLGSMGRAATWPVEWLFNARLSIDHSVVEPLAGEYGEPTFSDGIGRVRWTLSSNSALTLGMIMLDDKISLSSDGTQELATDRSRDLDTWLSWDWSPTNSIVSHTSVTLGNTERNSSGSLDVPGLVDGSLFAERSFSNRGLRSEWSYAPSSALKWDFGGEISHENAELQFQRQEIFTSPIVLGFGRPFDASITSNLSPRSFVWGLYTAARADWRALGAEFGLRLDGQNYQGFGARSQLSPRANFHYDLTDTWHSYASLGEFTQAQRVDEYRAEENQTAPDAASRAVHLLAGIEHESQDAIKWRLEIYRNHWTSIVPYYDNLLGLASLTPELAPDRVLISPSSAEAAGVELSGRRSFSHGFNAWGLYSLSRVTDDIRGQDILRSWDQTHTANVGVAWTEQRTSVSAVLGWHSGWPTTPLALIAASSTTPAYLAAGDRNSARWGSYLSADLRVATGISLHYGVLSLWVDASNVTDRSNACCAELTPINGTADAPGIVDKYWAPRTFNLGFSWRVKRP
jgi:hypothetical protein